MMKLRKLIAGAAALALMCGGAETSTTTTATTTTATSTSSVASVSEPKHETVTPQQIIGKWKLSKAENLSTGEKVDTSVDKDVSILFGTDNSLALYYGKEKVGTTGWTIVNDEEIHAGNGICFFDGTHIFIINNNNIYYLERIGDVQKFGDPNGDDKIDAQDASFVLSEYSALSTGSSIMNKDENNASDINKDGKIDSTDASSILQYYSYTSTGGKDSFEVYLGYES